MEIRSLGESKGNYTNSSVRQFKQKDTHTHHKTDINGRGNKLAVGLIAGAGVGMLAGMLLAPERGKVMRKQLANSAARVGDQVTKAMDMCVSSCKETMNSWTGSVGSWTGKGVDGGSTTHDKINKKAGLESNAGPDAVDKHVL